MSKTLLVSVDFPPHTDGVSTVSHALAQRLALDGHDLVVIGPRDAQQKAYDEAQPFRVLRSPGYDWGYLRIVPLAIVFLYALLRHRPSKVFAMNIAYGGLLAYTTRWLGFQYYLWAYGYEFHKVSKNHLLSTLYRNIYARAARIFVISRFVADRLAEFGVSREAMQMVHPAVDIQRFQPAGGSAGRTGSSAIVLSVARLVERKGHDLVLEALPEILRKVPQTQYWIAGDGPMRPVLEQMVSAKGLGEHVRFLGRVSDQELVDLYRRCDVFVMPSKECRDSGHVEGWGIVFLEANACGKPVVGARSGGMPEVIEEGRSGLLVNPHDAGELADAIVRLLTDKEYANRLGRAGRQRVLERFTWEKTLQGAMP